MKGAIWKVTPQMAEIAVCAFLIVRPAGRIYLGVYLIEYSEEAGSMKIMGFMMVAKNKLIV